MRLREPQVSRRPLLPSACDMVHLFSNTPSWWVTPHGAWGHAMRHAGMGLPVPDDQLCRMQLQWNASKIPFTCFSFHRKLYRTASREYDRQGP